MKPLSHRTLIASAVWAALSAQGVSAQLEEVIVTAEFREADIQDTPIAMEAFDAEEIQKRGITNVKDLFNTAVGVVGYESPTTRGTISLNIRGVGSGNPTLWQDPANAVYVDGVYVGKGTGNGVDVLDLERVEILRGPQGTLYGRNSTGGAVNFISRKPGSEMAARLILSAGNYGYQSLQGRVDVPLSDTFSMAASFQTRERDAFFNNSSATQQDFQGLDREGYRIALSWNPSDAFGVDYSYQRSEIDENTGMLKVDGFYPTAGAAPFAPGYPTQVSFDTDFRLQTVAGISAGVKAYVLPVAPLPQIQQFVNWADTYVAWFGERQGRFGTRDGGSGADYSNTSQSEVDAHSLTLSWQVGDSLTIKSITGYRDTVALGTNDIDGMDNSVNGGILHDTVLSTIGGLLFGQVPFPPAVNQFNLALSLIDGINEYGSTPLYTLIDSRNEYDQFSQELQFIGEFSDTVSYVAGVYYYEDSAQSRGIRSFSFPLAYSDSVAFDLDSDSLAVFGEVTWDMGNFSLTTGLRYTEETKDITYLHRAMPGTFDRLFGQLFATGSIAGFDWAGSYVASGADESAMPKASFFGEKESADFDNLSGRITAKYNISDDMNVYATYSTGYRSGGFNGGSYTPGLGADGYDEEDMTNIELGFKSTLMDGRMRLNASAFQYDYEDLQVNSVAEQNGALVSGINNAGKAKRDGLEVSLTWQLASSFVANVNWAHINGDFDEYPANIAPDGSILDVNALGLVGRGLAPDDQVTWSIDWDLFQSASSLVSWNLNGSWQTETQSLLVEGDVIGGVPVAMDTRKIDERSLINSRLSWEYELSGGNVVTVAAWGMNLTDEDYRTFGYGLRAGLGVNTQMYGAPRTYGIDVSISL
jgi:iron complex outermembrane receptor protein